jgi:hypothetical protein
LQPIQGGRAAYARCATLASAFVARWCAGYKVETAEGVFGVREDEPMPRVWGLHRTL